MFGWFGAVQPLDTGEKAWVETRLKLVSDRLGVDRLLRSRLLLAEPTEFPELAGDLRDDATLRALFDRIGRELGVATGELDLVLTEGEATVGPEGRHGVRLDDRRTHDREPLVAALARGLARFRLDAIGAATGTDPGEDRARAELLALALGFGVPLANAALHEDQVGEGRARRVEVAKQGELPAHLYGYALALWTFARQHGGHATEPRELARRLRPDARVPFQWGLRHVERTGDSLFLPETLRVSERPPTVAEAVARLGTGSPTRQLATLWSVRDQGLTHPDLVAPAARLLEGRDRALAAAAAEVLGRQGAPARSLVPALLRLAQKGDHPVSVAALHAMAELGVPPADLMPALGVLIIHDDPEIARAAARIATAPQPRKGTAALELGPILLEALVRGLVTCEEGLVTGAADALRTLGGLGPDSTRLAFRALDAELRRRVRGALADAGETA
jgi:hypothetical protein